MLRGVPRPRPNLDTAAFWDGCREGRFLLPTCTSCGRPRWPPGPMCPYCQSTETTWKETSGKGSVYSWVVATHPVDEALTDQVPYVIAMVELPEGVRVVANVAGVSPDEIAAGEPVELFFEDDPEGQLRLPNFRRVENDEPKEKR